MSISEITAALGAVKHALDIGKAISASGNAIEVAALRLQLAELMSALAEVKISVVDIQDQIAQRDAEIARLNDALANHAQTVKFQDAYYEKDDKGRATGAPYCMYCWEHQKRLIHLAQSGRTTEPARCPHCKNTFSGHLVYTIRHET